jgi:hypothetical protein
MRIALIDPNTNIIINIIVASDLNHAKSLAPDATCINFDALNYAIGGTFDGVNYTPPPNTPIIDPLTMQNINV